MTRKSQRPAKAPRTGTLELFRARLRSFESEVAGPQPAEGAVEAAIREAANGTDALALAAERQEPTHLLVTDVIMPGMSGSQLAERLQPARLAMKVLYISGYPEDSIAHHGVLDAGKCFLQEPFPPSRFLRAVRDVLDGPAPGCG